MKISKRQIDAVLGLPGSKRYEHFIKVAVDQRSVWGLYAEGWALAGTAEGGPVFPIWPARDYAEICAVAEWQGYQPREIEMDDLLEALLPSLRDRKTKLGVFYTPKDKGILPDIDQFEGDIRAELEKVE